MQHHDIPTRLLDWTENPFIALYFALSNGEKTVKGKYKKDAVVWYVNPEVWNNEVLSFQGFRDGILSTTDEQLNPFKPPAEFKTIPDYSLALHGSYNSARIVAQRGTFFIFGAPKNPMNKYFENKFTKDCLGTFIINKDDIEKMRNELLNSGITESVVFPDLNGLSHELKRIFGYSE